MSLEEAQEQVDDCIQQFDDGYWSAMSIQTRLVEEVGELAREVNQLHGDKPGDGDIECLADEMGDVLFTVLALANALDIDGESALDSVMTKYDVR